MAKFEELGFLLETFHQELDKVNSELLGFEFKINELRPGLEVWVPYSSFPGDYLGCGKISKKYRLLVKKTSPPRIYPLLEAPCDYRIEAISLLENLLEHITYAARERLQKLISVRDLTIGGESYVRESDYSHRH
jgi:hypothetical protein